MRGNEKGQFFSYFIAKYYSYFLKICYNKVYQDGTVIFHKSRSLRKLIHEYFFVNYYYREKTE